MSAHDPSDRAIAVRAHFAHQARACFGLGSPFMGRLMMLLAERDWPEGAVADAVLGWKGDARSVADNPSLRLAGGLHRLVLDGTDEDLARVYPPNTMSDEDLWSAVCSALVTHEPALLATLDRAPQTNEVRRAAALVPALALVARVVMRPLALWEIGCAAGLNLRADRFCVRTGTHIHGPTDSPVQLTPDWTGSAPAPFPFPVAERRGVDLAPLDPTTTEDRHRMLSYLWPDQPDRRHLTEAALDIAGAFPARIERADAIDWLADRLPNRPAGTATVLYHTIAWQYLPEAARLRGESLIAEAGARATTDAPLARIAMEDDGGHLAGLSLTLWPGATHSALARVDYHGRRVEWSGPVAL